MSTKAPVAAVAAISAASTASTRPNRRTVRSAVNEWLRDTSITPTEKKPVSRIARAASEVMRRLRVRMVSSTALATPVTSAPR